jgi:hypothetical protein
MRGDVRRWLGFELSWWLVALAFLAIGVHWVFALWVAAFAVVLVPTPTHMARLTARQRPEMAAYLIRAGLVFLAGTAAAVAIWIGLRR